jgi:ribosomal protein S18 acetylase RimI-like enzyme
MNIEYIETGVQDLDLIKPLWEKLNEHHRVRSKYFAEETGRRTFADRKKSLTDKSKAELRVTLAKDNNNGALIGYCVSSISAGEQGEVESIYVEPDYRKLGIGDALMQRALSWMDDKQIKRKRIGVGSGNEEVFGFYSRYGFYPRATILQQVEQR